jgi:hypothetical protein
MLTTLQIEALEKLHASSTQKWMNVDYGTKSIKFEMGEGASLSSSDTFPTRYFQYGKKHVNDQDVADMQFAVYSHTYFPQLLEDLKQLRAAVEELGRASCMENERGAMGELFALLDQWKAPVQ